MKVQSFVFCCWDDQDIKPDLAFNGRTECQRCKMKMFQTYAAQCCERAQLYAYKRWVVNLLLCIFATTLKSDPDVKMVALMDRTSVSRSGPLLLNAILAHVKI